MSVGFCYYRLPATTEIFLIEGALQTYTNLPDADAGFVFAPFAGGKKYCIGNFPVSVSSTRDKKEFWTLPIPNAPPETKEESIKRIEDFRSLIRKGVLKKIVAAKTNWMQDFSKINPFELFETLCREYPNAFVYLWSATETGTWMGATPEMLFRHQGLHGQTVALAGTRKRSDQTAFETKEIAEQQWVLKFLLETLTQNGCHNVVADPMKEINAGHLQHLVNTLSFELKDNDARWNILGKLHPTPAVSGYPQQEASERIVALEPFQRSYYSGYLGPYTQDSADIFVNLRCLQYGNNGVLLYAGAGITEDSVPEDEWNEMEEKMDTLKKWM